MIILVLILSFIVSCVAMYVVSFFSGEETDLATVLRATSIVWVISIILKDVPAPIGVIISTLVTMFVLVKFFGFEFVTSFFAGGLYAIINNIMLIVIVSFLM